jgi:hypothetical protein
MARPVQRGGGGRLCLNATSMGGTFEAPAMRNPVSTQRAGCALYDIDRTTGETIEIFCADRVVAQSFGARAAGWYWRRRGSPNLPTGPFIVCLDAYRNALPRLQEENPSSCIASADTVRTRR